MGPGACYGRHLNQGTLTRAPAPFVTGDGAPSLRVSRDRDGSAGRAPCLARNRVESRRGLFGMYEQPTASRYGYAQRPPRGLLHEQRIDVIPDRQAIPTYHANPPLLP
ncbi:hypothetical protein GCM10010404_57160 [Nonomuraea africana]